MPVISARARHPRRRILTSRPRPASTAIRAGSSDHAHVRSAVSPAEGSPRERLDRARESAASPGADSHARGTSSPSAPMSRGGDGTPAAIDSPRRARTSQTSATASAQGARRRAAAPVRGADAPGERHPGRALVNRSLRALAGDEERNARLRAGVDRHAEALLGLKAAGEQGVGPNGARESDANPATG